MERLGIASLAKWLERLRRTAISSISGALQRTAILTTNIILHIASANIAGRCLCKTKARYMKLFKQAHPEIISFCDCIPGNLDHCLAEFILGRLL